MSTIIIIQARMGSTRLPGKVLKSVGGKPLLGYLFERLSRVRSADGYVVATSTLPGDQPIVDFCNEHNVPSFCGSEQDVLDRFYQGAKAYQPDTVVRITGDCPLIDPSVIDLAIDTFNSQPTCDYLSNTLERSYPRGMDVEVFTFKALEEAHQESTSDWDREHVTPFIYNQPDRFQIQQLSASEDTSQYRLTVDTEEDFSLVSRIFEDLYPENPRFNLTDMLQLLKKHPEWEKINAHVEQKTHPESK